MRRNHICSQPFSAIVSLRHFIMDSQHPGCWTGSVLACNPAVRHRRLSHFHTLSESARNNCCPLYVHFLNVVFQNKNKMLQSQEIQDKNYLLTIVFFRHRDLDMSYFTSLPFHYFEYFDIYLNVRSIKWKWYSRLKIQRNKFSKTKFWVQICVSDNDVDEDFQAAQSSRSTSTMEAASSPKRCQPFINLHVVVSQKYNCAWPEYLLPRAVYDFLQSFQANTDRVNQIKPQTFFFVMFNLLFTASPAI